MKKWIPSCLIGVLNVTLVTFHTIFWCLSLYFLYLLKLILPVPRWQNMLDPWLIAMGQNWIRSNNLLIALTLDIKWDLPDLQSMRTDQWYFIISNHQSWTDILVLQKIFLNKIPFIRFFIKKELLWLPFLNLAWFAFDFPIMHRHSKEMLAKHPELRKKDFEATHKACERYKDKPVTVLNFLEGTRFTPKKHAIQQSPYKHLLIPKSGGFAYAVNVMDKRIQNVLDVTIAYPEGRRTFWDFLCNRVHRITVIVKEHQIPPALLEGSYSDDEAYRLQFKLWVNTLWEEKNRTLDPLYTFE